MLALWVVLAAVLLGIFGGVVRRVACYRLWVPYRGRPNYPYLGGVGVMEPWRWRCPNGHVSWESAAAGYRCRSCGETFEALSDAKGGVSA
jgi:hypothetical protein